MSTSPQFDIYGPKIVDWEDPRASAASSPRPSSMSDLEARMRTLVGRPVDTLHIAAALESDGVTDSAAADRFGYANVFRLADDLFPQLDTATTVTAPATTVSRKARLGQATRDLSHGPLYLLPSALLPTALVLIGHHRLAVALVIASGFGWVWSAGSAWLAYRMMSRGLPACAARVLRATTLVGIAAGILIIVAMSVLTGGLMSGTVVVAGLLAFQTAAAIALVYRREVWIFATMAPGVAVAVIRVASGHPTAGVTAMVGGASLLITLGSMMWLTTRPPDVAGSRGGEEQQVRLWPAIRSELPAMGAIALYALLSAAFLLHVDARYVSGALGLAVAAAPLILGMGVVEWRVHRFHGRASALLDRVRRPREFRVAVWLLLTGELVTVVALIGGLGAALGYGLWRAGLLTEPATMLITAHVAVAGAYFLAFIVASNGRYARLSTALALSLGVQIVLARRLPGGFDAMNDATAFLVSAVLLQLLLLVALIRDLGRAWQYGPA